MAEPFQKGVLPRGEQMEGRVSSIVNVVPQGWDGHRLRHHDFDETFYVLVDPLRESTPETIVVGRSIRQRPVLLGALVTGVLRGGEADAVARFTAILQLIGPRVLAPATVAVVGLGVWSNNAAWDFGQLWVQLALALFAAAFLIGAFHQSRAAINAERAAAGGEHDEALWHLTRWSWGYRLIVLIPVWDMVFKPGL